MTSLTIRKGFPGGSGVENPSAKQEMEVQSLGQEDPLKKEMATHSSILAWKFHGQKSLAGYTPWGHIDPDATEQLSLSHSQALVSSEGLSFSEVSFSYKECLAMCSNVSKK